MTEEEIHNLNDGGTCCAFDILEALKCCAFDILEALKDAFSGDKFMQDRILPTIKPDILRTKQPNMQALTLKFSTLKITTRIGKMGKDTTTIFKMFD
eukprot:CAMPEP_0176392638 /NCGR_PEP_ID=MMETSP0126-20121128/41030_1 /TAXON_ID=141414 ORGANISM="Strombidinopsis acuminatum, Strain SPMC142" /NCGR_SAMPLE_ID=MMETSP0126 /ASSEMBLY_ACC=CAM_ASM_000229 /LENGTH=96 /DNA_ID=CAMNT_0017763559 /DNA_START=52 /DNA_END=342 /DNA_ORIENTATION=-